LSTNIILAHSDDNVSRNVVGTHTRVQLRKSLSGQAESGKQSHKTPVSASSLQTAVSSRRKSASNTNTGGSASQVLLNISKIGQTSSNDSKSSGKLFFWLVSESAQTISGPNPGGSPNSPGELSNKVRVVNKILSQSFTSSFVHILVLHTEKTTTTVIASAIVESAVSCNIGFSELNESRCQSSSKSQEASNARQCGNSGLGQSLVNVRQVAGNSGVSGGPSFQDRRIQTVHLIQSDINSGLGHNGTPKRADCKEQS